MPRPTNAIARRLPRIVLPAALLSLTACGTMNATPQTTELAAQKQGASGKAVNLIKDGSFEAATPVWSASTPGVLCKVSTCQDGKAKKGTGWARLGSSDLTSETLSQSLTLPRGRARFEFYLWDAATGAGTLELLVDGKAVFSYATSDGTVGAGGDEGKEGPEDETEDGDDYGGKGGRDRLVTARSVGESENETEGDYTAGYEKVKLELSDFADDKPYTLTFRLTDVAGGSARVSLDEVALEVKPLKDLLPVISQELSALKLPSTVSKPLAQRLDKAAAALARKDLKTTSKEMKAFAKEVHGQRGKKIKTAAADSLEREALEVAEIAG